MKMRPGGREIESVVTKTPGKLEFFPNLPTQHHRTLDGNDFVIAYADKNRVGSSRPPTRRRRPTLRSRS